MPAYSPRDIHTLFEQAFNHSDVEAITALYEPGAVLMIDGRQVVGREGIRNAFETLVAGRGRMTLETRAVVETHLGLAVLHGGWVIEASTAAGSDVATRGLSTEVVRKQPDGTRLFVIDSPPTPTPSDR